MKIRVILVEPHEAGNVGAAARAMKNFGVRDLWIVGTRPQREDTISSWWAKGADDLVTAAKRSDALTDALAGCHLSIATTAVRGREVRNVLDPSAAAALAATSLTSDQTVAVVFGREESGLTQAEIALCQRTATIPTDAEFPTMNLAQSVALFCWEMRKAASTTRTERVDEDQLPPIELVHRLRDRARLLLEAIDFLDEATGPRVMRELSAFADRAGMSRREASLLLALIRRLELRLGLRRGAGGLDS